MKRITLLMGPPGAGKGTKSAGLSQKLGATHISSGDLFRAEKARQTPEGLVFASYQEKGILIPDDLADPFIFQKLDEHPSEHILLDGYPRTKRQAWTLMDWARSREVPIVQVILVTCPDEEILNRLLGRRICKVCFAGFHVIHNPPITLSGNCDRCGGEVIRRPDDDNELVLSRLKDYHELTEPAIQALLEEGVPLTNG